MRIHNQQRKQVTRKQGKARFDASLRVIRDVLLIRDPDEGKRGVLTIRYRGGETIVTTDNVPRALALLRVIEVDAVFHLGRRVSERDLDFFRTEVARRYPNVRFMDIRTTEPGARLYYPNPPEAAPETEKAPG